MSCSSAQDRPPRRVRPERRSRCPRRGAVGPTARHGSAAGCRSHLCRHRETAWFIPQLMVEPEAGDLRPVNGCCRGSSLWMLACRPAEWMERSPRLPDDTKLVMDLPRRLWSGSKSPYCPDGMRRTSNLLRRRPALGQAGFIGSVGSVAASSGSAGAVGTGSSSSSSEGRPRQDHQNGRMVTRSGVRAGETSWCLLSSRQNTVQAASSRGNAESLIAVRRAGIRNVE